MFLSKLHSTLLLLLAGPTLGFGAGLDFGIEQQHPLGPSPLNELERAGKQPNIIFILTDDQDYHLGSLDYTPLIRRHLIEKGTHYRRHFCTTVRSRKKQQLCVRVVS